MIQTYNILSLLLDYPTAELWNSRDEVLPVLTAEGVLSEKVLDGVRSFLDYVATFADARSWQAAYSDLFDTSTKTNLYLFDMVYGTSRDRGQAMVDLKEEYLRAPKTSCPTTCRCICSMSPTWTTRQKPTRPSTTSVACSRKWTSGLPRNSIPTSRLLPS